MKRRNARRAAPVKERRAQVKAARAAAVAARKAAREACRAAVAQAVARRDAATAALAAARAGIATARTDCAGKRAEAAASAGDALERAKEELAAAQRAVAEARKRRVELAPTKPAPAPAASPRMPSVPPAAALPSTDLATFARAAIEVGAGVQREGRMGRTKALIGNVHDRWAGPETLDAFKARLVEAHRAGLLTLHRLDMPQGFSPDVVARSRVTTADGFGEFHLLQVPALAEDVPAPMPAPVAVPVAPRPPARSGETSKEGEAARAKYGTLFLRRWYVSRHPDGHEIGWFQPFESLKNGGWRGWHVSLGGRSRYAAAKGTVKPIDLQRWRDTTPFREEDPPHEVLDAVARRGAEAGEADAASPVVPRYVPKADTHENGREGYRVWDRKGRHWGSYGLSGFWLTQEGAEKAIKAAGQEMMPREDAERNDAKTAAEAQERAAYEARTRELLARPVFAAFLRRVEARDPLYTSADILRNVPDADEALQLASGGRRWIEAKWYRRGPPADLTTAEFRAGSGRQGLRAFLATLPAARAPGVVRLGQWYRGRGPKGEDDFFLAYKHVPKSADFPGGFLGPWVSRADDGKPEGVLTRRRGHDLDGWDELDPPEDLRRFGEALITRLDVEPRGDPTLPSWRTAPGGHPVWTTGATFEGIDMIATAPRSTVADTRWQVAVGRGGKLLAVYEIGESRQHGDMWMRQIHGDHVPAAAEERIARFWGVPTTKRNPACAPCATKNPNVGPGMRAWERWRKLRRNPSGATPDEARAVDEYRRLHWGNRGREVVDTLSAPDPRQGTLVQLGEIVSVVYVTSKRGDPDGCEYEHEFGDESIPVEDRIRHGQLPVLCVTRDGKLVIAERRRKPGSYPGYRVKEEGIVG